MDSPLFFLFHFFLPFLLTLFFRIIYPLHYTLTYRIWLDFQWTMSRPPDHSILSVWAATCQLHLNCFVYFLPILQFEFPIIFFSSFSPFGYLFSRWISRYPIRSDTSQSREREKKRTGKTKLIRCALKLFNIELPFVVMDQWIHIYILYFCGSNSCGCIIVVRTRVAVLLLWHIELY